MCNWGNATQMIHKAIEALDEGEGSSKASISAFIKSNYHDLPWAHESFLTCHLTKLIEKDEIFLAPSSSCNMFRIRKHEEPANNNMKKKKCGRPSKPKERKRRGRPPKKEAVMKRGGEESRRGQGVVVVAPCPPVMPSILA
ncbi:hmg-y-related protein a [Quercus suber]|uniref:Hmg-y-related protein a n=1 Tax=Quercus suber TaxID=58331 RepID=A0AAW0L0G5_QUESU